MLQLAVHFYRKCPHLLANGMCMPFNCACSICTLCYTLQQSSKYYNPPSVLHYSAFIFVAVASGYKDTKIFTVYPSSDGGGCSILAVSLENLSLTANRTSLSASVRVRSKARIVPAWSVRIILPYREEHIITGEESYYNYYKAHSQRET